MPPDRPGPGRGRRAVAAGLWALAAAHVAEAIVLRRRAARLVTLDSRPPSWDRPAAEVVARAGVRVGPGVGVAAAEEMAGVGLRVLDLVPADLAAGPALRLLRRVAPERFAREWLYAPGGAHHALALAPDLVGSVCDRQSAGDAPDLARLTLRAQRHAPRAAGVRVSSDVTAVGDAAAERWRVAEQATAFAAPVLTLAPLLVAARTAHLAAMTAGLVVAPAPGLAAAISWSGQPAIVFGARPGSAPPALRPPRLVAASARRLVDDWAATAGTVLAGVRATRARARAHADEGLPRVSVGTAFGAPRTDCPWCGAGDLRGRLDTTDVTGRIPGPVHLDECRSCGHLFQNPALSDSGLEHCYRDLYDGAGDESTEAVFAAMAPAYRRRIATIAAVTTPTSVLDVGTGHAHFCLAARQRWPGATVDGLDQSPAVDEARGRGWIDDAYRGAFRDLADGLPRSYDVVTMSHYLEHTRDPRCELAAAAKVLEPGGYLMVEVPDPASPWARRLGRCWSQWVQPQHLHFVPCANLVAALRADGFDVVSVERAAAHLGGNLVLGLGQAVERLAPCAHHAGRRRLPPAARARRATVLAAAAPVAALAAGADAVIDGVMRSVGGSRPGDAYRVLARRV